MKGEKKDRAKERTYIQAYRDIPEWIKKDPIIFHLLSEFARRARREPGLATWHGEVIPLKTREFITGRRAVSKEIGITVRQYRTAYQKVTKRRLIVTIRATRRYTISKYLADEIFDINIKGNRPTDRPTEYPTDVPQTTTNNNDNNDKNINIQPSAVDSNKKKDSAQEPQDLPAPRGGVESVGRYLEKRGIKPHKPVSFNKWQEDADRIAKSLKIKKPLR